MSDITLSLTPAVYAYLQRNSLREHPILQECRVQTQKMSMSQMQISPEQGQFMAFLVELLQAQKVLELGVFTGYSSLAIALSLPKEGRIIACDTNPEWTKIAKRFWEKAEVAEKIDLRLQPALITLDALIAEGAEASFDFAFIDADKANYIEYYQRVLTLLRPGGVMAIDNVLQRGAVVDPHNHERNVEIIRELNQLLLNDTRISLSMLPIGDGLTLVYKRKDALNLH